MKIIGHGAAAMLALTVACTANAAPLRDRICASFSGGHYSTWIDETGAIRPVFGDWMLWQPESAVAEDGFWPANARDWSRPGSPCPDYAITNASPMATVKSSDGQFDYETTFHERKRGTGSIWQGACRVVTETWRFQTASDYGTGVMCARILNGPALEISPLTVRVKQQGVLHVRATKNGAAVARLPIDLQLVPQNGGGQFIGQCAGITSSEGRFQCSYRAPDKPLTETVRMSSIQFVQPIKGQIKVTPPAIVLGFFNGVWNTEKQSQDGLEAIRELIGPKHGDTELRYEKFYNQTGSANGNTALQDIAEVFIQRGDELQKVLSERWELYWELLSGRAPIEGSLTHRLLSGFKLGGTRLSDLVEAVVARMVTGFAKGLSQMLSNPPTGADVAAHLAKLQGLADEDYAFALVAHSQGNLFVNVAYDGLKQTRPQAIASVVHVAPASPTLRGEHVLAEIDLVINGLRALGPGAVPPINLWLHDRGGDPSGHTLVGTYLDGTRPARSHVQGMITHALDEVAPAGP